MSRTGKIARLRHAIRRQINLRLQEGEGGQSLLNWINSLPQVQSYVAKDFASIPVTDGNLSEWRRGGYRDWLRVQQECDVVRLLREDSQLLNPAGGPRSRLGNHLSSVLTTEIASLAPLFLSNTTQPAKRFKLLSEVLRELIQLRKADCRADQARINAERWELEQERLSMKPSSANQVKSE